MEEVNNQNPAAIDSQPKLIDPLEIGIRSRLKQELLSTPWACSLFDQMQALQTEFFKFALANLSETGQIRNKYLQLLDQLISRGQVKITGGEQFLTELDAQKAVIVITNHLGTAKLTAFPPSDINLKVSIDIVEPFPIRHAALYLLAKQLQRPVAEAAIELPNPLNQVQQAAGVILVAAGGNSRLAQLERNTQKKVAKNNNALIVMYPEGGTSGKRNNSGPYNLDGFQTGAFVVAGHLGIPILPVCQYFNPKSGFELGVLPPIKVDRTDNREYFQQLAKSTQTSMQEWLNSRK